jgi:hypothetical protein
VSLRFEVVSIRGFKQESMRSTGYGWEDWHIITESGQLQNSLLPSLLFPLSLREQTLLEPAQPHRQSSFTPCRAIKRHARMKSMYTSLDLRRRSPQLVPQLATVGLLLHLEDRTDSHVLQRVLFTLSSV